MARSRLDRHNRRVTSTADLSDHDVAALVRDGYDTIAAKYAAYATASLSHPRRVWLGDLLGRLRPGSKILELGCGPGVPTGASIVDAGHDLVGVDISTGQIELANQRVPSARFITANMIDVHFEPGEFDAVVALFSLIHVRRCHYEELFAKIRRWLIPDGWFLASLGSADSPGWLEEDLLGLGATNWTNGFDVATTTRLLVGAGFVLRRAEIVKHDEPTGPEQWLYVMARAARPVAPRRRHIPSTPTS
jgi:cyclopropane fatty-acyl-phospholipid synthase-like methyltransferase